MRGKRQPMAPRTLQGVCIDQGFEAGIRQERHEIEGLASIFCPMDTDCVLGASVSADGGDRRSSACRPPACKSHGTQ
jgi:hypothetical protein